MSDPTLNTFENSMKSLDEMIKKLEIKLGKNHSISPFDELRKKYNKD
jgi:exonuclease VII small subunit